MRERAQVAHLLAYIEGEPTDSARQFMRQAAVEMSRREGWSLGGPQYVDQGDADDWTIGVHLSVLPASTQLDSERRALDDVEAFVSALERLSGPEHDGAVEMSGEIVDFVEHGRRDDLLQRGRHAPYDPEPEPSRRFLQSRQS